MESVAWSRREVSRPFPSLLRHYHMRFLLTRKAVPHDGQHRLLARPQRRSLHDRFSRYFVVINSSDNRHPYGGSDSFVDEAKLQHAGNPRLYALWLAHSVRDPTY
jgi:hypothetical protein